MLVQVGQQRKLFRGKRDQSPVDPHHARCNVHLELRKDGVTESDVWIVKDMPKTRSGKIMRRVLAAISDSRDIGDVTTLANPEVVEEIRIQVQGDDPETPL